jgi:hypothetical protein
MPPLTFAQQRAEDKLKRRGLRTNEAGDIEAIPATSDDAGDDDAALTLKTQADINRDIVPQDKAVANDQELRTMFAQLQADHEALKGRLAPAQRDADNYRGLYETSSRELNAAREQTQSELAELRLQLDEATTARERKSIEAEIEELISEEDRAAIDPSVLAVIRKVAGKFAGGKPAAAVDHNMLVEKALAERERKTIDAHRNRMLADQNTELGKLKQLSQDAAFNAYCEENPEVDMTLTHFLHASTTADIDRYARAANRLISAYRTGKTPTEATRAADPKSAGGSVLQSALARTAAVKMSEEQLREKTREFKQLIRNNNPESKAKAKLLMAEIEANT